MSNPTITLHGLALTQDEQSKIYSKPSVKA